MKNYLKKKLTTRFIGLQLSLLFAALLFATALETSIPGTYIAVQGISYTLTKIYPSLDASFLTVPSPGDFTCSVALEIEGMVDERWADNAARKDYIAQVNTAVFVAENISTAKLDPIQDPRKERVLKLIWPQDCGNVDTTCSDYCDFSGNELSSQCKEVELNLCREYPFKVESRLLRTNVIEYQDLVATGMLRAKKFLGEYINTQAILAIDAYAGVNSYTGGIGTVSGTDTTIPSALWGMNAFAYMDTVIEFNKFANANFLSGTLLRESYLLSRWNAGNSDGKGQEAAFGSMDISLENFDVKIDSTLGERAAFLIERGALALVSKVENPSSPINNGAKDPMMLWSTPDGTIPGIFYDVYHQRACEGNQVFDYFKVVFRGALPQSPLGCDELNTGIIKMLCA